MLLLCLSHTHADQRPRGQAADSTHTAPKCKRVQVLMTVLRFGSVNDYSAEINTLGSIYFTSLFIFVPFVKITITFVRI